jgi:hypothetical protein
MVEYQVQITHPQAQGRFWYSSTAVVNVKPETFEIVHAGTLSPASQVVTGLDPFTTIKLEDVQVTRNGAVFTGYDIIWHRQQSTDDGATWGPWGFVATGANQYTPTRPLPYALYRYRVQIVIDQAQPYIAEYSTDSYVAYSADVYLISDAGQVSPPSQSLVFGNPVALLAHSAPSFTKNGQPFTLPFTRFWQRSFSADGVNWPPFQTVSAGAQTQQPANLTVGHHKYRCEVTSPQASNSPQYSQEAVIEITPVPLELVYLTEITAGNGTPIPWVSGHVFNIYIPENGLMSAILRIGAVGKINNGPQLLITNPMQPGVFFKWERRIKPKTTGIWGAWQVLRDGEGSFFDSWFR